MLLYKKMDYCWNLHFGQAWNVGAQPWFALAQTESSGIITHITQSCRNQSTKQTLSQIGQNDFQKIPKFWAIIVTLQAWDHIYKTAFQAS